MYASRIMICLAATAALALSACGDDDDEKTGGGSTTPATTQEQTGSAEGAELTDVEPRSAKPNLAGGDAAIDQFINQYAEDATSYWRQVFENSQAQYRQPDIAVMSEAGDHGCRKPFDPTKAPGFFYCAFEQGGSELTYGAPFLDKIRTDLGDGGTAFLVGFGAALDAHNQLSGNPVGRNEEVGDDFVQLAGCFTGAWIRNLNDRQVLQEGDDQEILNLAGQFLPGSEANLGKKAVAFGHDNGAGPCQQEYGGETPPTDG